MSSQTSNNICFIFLLYILQLKSMGIPGLHFLLIYPFCDDCCLLAWFVFHAVSLSPNFENTTIQRNRLASWYAIIEGNQNQTRNWFWFFKTRRTHIKFRYHLFHDNFLDFCSFHEQFLKINYVILYRLLNALTVPKISTYWLIRGCV